MNRTLRGLLLALMAATSACAQQNLPRAAFVYPAGGKIGSSFEVTVGGQFLEGSTQVFFAGEGVRAEVVGFLKPLAQKDLEELRNQLRDLEQSHSPAPAKPAPAPAATAPTQVPAATSPAKAPFSISPATATVTPAPSPAAPASTTKEIPPKPPTPWTLEDRKLAAELHRQIDADQRRRQVPALSQSVQLRVTISASAAIGNHELRLLTKQGLTNPLNFLVDRFPESSRPARMVPLSLAAGGGLPLAAQAHADAAEAVVKITVPTILNGQMMPGSLDRYNFHAGKGQKIVVAAMTRALIPYMSDAVPGWFQAVLTLTDSKGKELATADHFRFNQEAVIEEEIAEEGDYTLSVRDVLNRGREDFVYRIAIGEVPFVTGIFPMGGKVGAHAKVEANGWNLAGAQLKAAPTETGIHAIPGGGKGWLGENSVAFSVSDLPETILKKPALNLASAHRIKLPQIVNGRIEHPGEVHYFRIDGNAGEEMVAEVEARRLGSPLDPVLTLTDAHGKQLTFNDDFEDKGAALLTHQADSRLSYRFPARGAYFLQLTDTEQNGGADFSYRLHISHPRPNFELRVAPSSINLRPGRTIPLQVLLLRRDGFNGPVTLRIQDGTPGLILGGGTVPAGTDSLRVTLTAPPAAIANPCRFTLVGEASIDGQIVRHVGIPAEEMVQAFALHRIVAVQQALLLVTGGEHSKPLWAAIDGRLRLPVGGSVQLRLPVPAWQKENQLQFALSDPPEGITLAIVSQDSGFVHLRLSADRKLTPGLAGNLLVEASSLKPAVATTPPTKPQRPNALGLLPAIPFEIVQP